MTGLIISLGLVNWIVTTIVVDAEICRPIRELIDIRLWNSSQLGVPPWRYNAWNKVRYLVTCHLCAGVWVGFLLACLVPGARPLGNGLVGFVLAGLVIKAAGHITLEVTALLRALNARAKP